jgi:Trp operon repressor
MADLMLATYEANEKHPLLLTQDEKKAHVFRLMLNGVLMDKSIDQLHKIFFHSF